MFFIFFVKKGKADYNFVDTVLNLGRVLFLDTVSFLGRVLNFSINNQDKYEGAFLAERRVLATFQSGAPRFAFYDQGFCLHGILLLIVHWTISRVRLINSETGNTWRFRRQSLLYDKSQKS